MKKGPLEMFRLEIPKSFRGRWTPVPIVRVPESEKFPSKWNRADHPREMGRCRGIDVPDGPYERGAHRERNVSGPTSLSPAS